MTNVEKANDKVIKEIRKSLDNYKFYENPDMLFCITTEDVVYQANELGKKLTLNEAREVGRRAFKHYESDSEMSVIKDTLTEEE